MYSIVIVDDEKIIRSGLTNFIDWHSKGFEVVASLSDGDEAIEYLRGHSVDVVLTDINMPNVTGLDLAKYISENCIETKVVMISGYKDFEYAKKAIEYNVINYILKPLDMDEIESVFKALYETINEERKQHLEREEEKQLYAELIPLMKQQFFQDIFMGALREESLIRRRLEQLKMNINPSETACCIAEVSLLDYQRFINEDWHYEKERLRTAIINFVDQERAGFKYICVFSSDETFSIVILYSNEMSRIAAHDAIKESLAGIQSMIFSMLRLDLTYALSSCYKDLFELSRSNQIFSVSKRQASTRENTLVPIEFDYLNLQKVIKSVMVKINENSIDEANNLMTRFLEDIVEYSIEEVHKLILEFFSILCNMYNDMGINLWSNMNADHNYHNIMNVSEFNEIIKQCHGIIQFMQEEVLRQKNKSEKSSIGSAIEYILHNYQKDISREDVADYVFLNASYFSRCFKEEIGETFSSYLTKIRMNKAIELLLSGKYKIYEISEKVGYAHSKNFTRVFKKFTGRTPVEYIRNHVRDMSVDYE